MRMDTRKITADNNQLSADLDAASRRVGLRVFVLGAAIQTIAVYLFCLGIFSYTSYSRAQFRGDVWSFEDWKTELGDQLVLWVAIGLGGLALAVASMPAGHWAGKMIGIRKYRFVWVGPVAAFFPTLVGGLTITLAAFAYRSAINHYGIGSFLEDFVIPAVLFALGFYLPGIVTSLLGGLVIRQKMRGKTEDFEREMAHQQQQE